MNTSSKLVACKSRFIVVQQTCRLKIKTKAREVFVEYLMQVNQSLLREQFTTFLYQSLVSVNIPMVSQWRMDPPLLTHQSYPQWRLHPPLIVSQWRLHPPLIGSQWRFILHYTFSVPLPPSSLVTLRRGLPSAPSSSAVSSMAVEDLAATLLLWRFLLRELFFLCLLMMTSVVWRSFSNSSSSTTPPVREGRMSLSLLQNLIYYKTLLLHNC